VNDALGAGEPYIVVCLDVMLPDKSGVEVLKSIRAIEEECGIFGLAGAKVIMTTSREDSGTVLSAFNAGCEVYLIKPFSRAELLSTISSLGVEFPLD